MKDMGLNNHNSPFCSYKLFTELCTFCNPILIKEKKLLQTMGHDISIMFIYDMLYNKDLKFLALSFNLFNNSLTLSSSSVFMQIDPEWV